MHACLNLDSLPSKHSAKGHIKIERQIASSHDDDDDDAHEVNARDMNVCVLVSSVGKKSTAGVYTVCTRTIVFEAVSSIDNTYCCKDSVRASKCTFMHNTTSVLSTAEDYFLPQRLPTNPSKKIQPSCRISVGLLTYNGRSTLLTTVMAEKKLAGWGNFGNGLVWLFG